MKRIKNKLAALIIIAALLVVALDALSDVGGTSLNDNKIRVGLIESEQYEVFGYYLDGIAEGLQRIGVIDGYSTDEFESDTHIIWDILAECESDSLSFVRDSFYTMKDMDEEEYSLFIDSESVDLWIILGTRAGIYMTENENKNDYMVIASQDPIAAGIVKSGTERIKPNSYAYIDLERISRQIEIGYNVFKFNKIGVVYENPIAYAYSGIAPLYRKAEEHGFEIVERHVDESLGETDDERYYAELKAAYSELIDEGIDALYITVATISAERLPWLLEDIKRAGVATISQSGGNEIEYGVILGVSLSDYQDEGRRIAELLREYIDGVPIAKLDQIYRIVPKISLNYDSLTDSGLKLPVKILLSFDEIIRER